MTREEAKKVFEYLEKKANTQEPCDDTVSREAVSEIINDIRDCISVEGYWAIQERLKQLPSVTPKNHDKMMKVAYEQGKKDFEQMSYVSKEEMQECKEIVKKYTPKRQAGEWIDVTNGTPIPDNATNADVIRTLFPDGIPKDIVWTLQNDKGANWWNAPYQKGGKE